ncbi:MAG: hypothetical protein DRJ10_13805 [Bacteroidetes bacterium]|nr:MAG: hypothetical protein DRJ10_13805 [Bacteroidota bacterium]
MKPLFIFFLFGLFYINYALAQTGSIENKNEKYGIVDSKTKKLIANYIYEDIETVHGTGYLVMKNEKIGLLSKSGKLIFDCVYFEIYPLLDNPNYVVLESMNNSLSVYSIRDKKYVFSKFLADINNPLCGPYDELTGTVSKLVVIASKNGKSGVLELPSKIVLPFQYDKIIACESKRGVIIMKKLNKYRFYNLKNRQLLSPEFEVNGSEKNLPIKNGICFAEATDYFPAKVKGKWGIMNMNGKFRIQPKFEKLRISPYTSSKNPFTVVYLQNSWFTHNYGKMKPFNIDYLLGFWYNYAVIIKNEKVLFYNTKGEKFTELKLKNTADTKIKAFQKNSKFGVVSNKSKLILDFVFQDIEISKNLIFAKKNNKYALLNAEGKEITGHKYYDIRMGSIKDKTLIIKQFGKYGLISFEGSEILKPKYTFISNYTNGKATAKLYKSEFEIDTKGNKSN